MAIIRTIWTSKSSVESDNHIGRAGEIWYDPAVGQLLLSDGETVGGIAIGGGGGGVSGLGPRGYTGSAGVGYTGSLGTVGYTGSTGIGYTGSIGSTGYNGSVGYTGSTSVGFTGSIGSGYSGSTGFTGSVGYYGSTGYTGSTGIGYTGSASTTNGYTGSIGYTGSQGSTDASILTGTTLNSTIVNSSLTSVGTLTNLTVTNTIAGSINGSVIWINPSPSPSTIFRTAVTSSSTGIAIDIHQGLPNLGTDYSWLFDTTKITFPDTSTQTTAWTGTAAAGTLTGTTLNSTVVTSSLTSVGTLANLTVTNTITGSVSGNAATATSAATLTTARTINGVSFNGSANINIDNITNGTNSMKITAVPSALTGATGDVVGSVAFDSTYIYYCFQAYTGASYSLPIVSGGGLIQVTVNAGSTGLRVALVAAFAAIPTGWTYGGAPITNITGSNQIIVITMSSGYSGFNNGVSYTLVQPPASANWKTTPWGAITSAAAGSLTGSTLASGVTSSSLTSFGASPAVTTSLTTPSTSFDLINTTATTVNFAKAATALSMGASTGTTTINNDLVMASGKTIGTTATVTSNHATAFSAGDSAISNVALSIPQNAAIRDRTNGASTMYFDVSNGGTTDGVFSFRSSSNYTSVLTMSPTAVSINAGATVTSRTPSLARLAWNSAIDTELTVDEMRFRISNQSGIFPQVISNTGGSKNLGWTGVGATSGVAISQVGSTGTIVPNNAWITLYNAHGMDSPADTVTVTLQDKALGRIYRVTFMRSDNGSTTGYNIIAERLL